MAQHIDPAVAKQHLQNRLRDVAKDLVHRVYGPDGIPWGTQFAEIEDIAVELGRAISQGMIEHGLGLQASAVPSETELCGCGERIDPADDMRFRSVQTRAGVAQWQEPKRYCRQCRAAFFPSEPRVGDR